MLRTKYFWFLDVFAVSKKQNEYLWDLSVVGSQDWYTARVAAVIQIQAIKAADAWNMIPD